MNYIPCFVAPVSQVRSHSHDIPVKQVQCHCPQACWVALSTLAACDKVGGKPSYYCPTCIPDDVRDQVQALSDQAKARILTGEHDPGQPIAGVILSPRNYHEQA